LGSRALSEAEGLPALAGPSFTFQILSLSRFKRRALLDLNPLFPTAAIDPKIG
jgi:hypothetical protein